MSPDKFGAIRPNGGAIIEAEIPWENPIHLNGILNQGTFCRA